MLVVGSVPTDALGTRSEAQASGFQPTEGSSRPMAKAFAGNTGAASNRFIA
jgi:hypothetical protein